jgi:hypothetical protein
MAGASIDLTETIILGALRLVLLTLFPALEIVRGEINRVPEPPGDDFIVMTPMMRTRLGSTISTWHDGWFDSPQVPGTRMETEPTQITVQLDVHGPASADNVQIISTLCRSEAMTAAFDQTGLALQILYASDPRQTPFINAEQQIEFRWSIDAVLQANPVVTLPQDFADTLTPTLIDYI